MADNPLNRNGTFFVLRCLSFVGRKMWREALQLLEKYLMKNMNDCLMVSGGHDAGEWRIYAYLLELAFVLIPAANELYEAAAPDATQMPGRRQERTKKSRIDLMKRLRKLEQNRLSADPAAAAMPAHFKSRLSTLRAFALYEKAKKLRIRAARDSHSHGSRERNKILEESISEAETGLQLCPGNWRCLWVMGKACREMKRPLAAQKIFQLIKEVQGVGKSLGDENRRGDVHMIRSRDSAIAMGRGSELDLPRDGDREGEILDLVLLQETASTLAALTDPKRADCTRLSKCVQEYLSKRHSNIAFLVDLAESLVSPQVSQVCVYLCV